MHIIVILALVIVAWAAVEWMFFKEVARTWRDSKLKRSAKICAVVMACIDIPLAWLSPSVAILPLARNSEGDSIGKKWCNAAVNAVL